MRVLRNFRVFLGPGCRLLGAVNLFPDRTIKRRYTQTFSASMYIPDVQIKKSIS